MKNFQNFKKLESYEKIASNIEDQLIVLIPNIFFNFLELSQNQINSVLANPEQKVSGKIDFQNTTVSKLIGEYIELSHTIQSEFGIPTSLKITQRDKVESRLLMSQLILQYARLELLKPSMAVFHFLKVLSKTERILYKTKLPFFIDVPTVSFYIPDLLLKDSLGNFDPEKTIEQENLTNNIKINFSIFKSSPILAENLYRKLLLNSKNMLFGLIKKKLSKEVCDNVSRIISRLSAGNIYNTIGKGVKLSLAKSEVRENFIQIAKEYIATGNCKNDEIRLGETIFNTISESLENIQFNNDDFKLKLSQEFLRIALEEVIAWKNFPENFYILNFRPADEDEIISPEVETMMDLKLINADNTIESDIYETYAICYPEEIKDMMNVLASKGINN